MLGLSVRSAVALTLVVGLAADEVGGVRRLGTPPSCASTPCLHEGKCIELPNQAAHVDYTCVCLEAYDGVNCNADAATLHIDVNLRDEMPGAKGVQAVVDGELTSEFATGTDGLIALGSRTAVHVWSSVGVDVVLGPPAVETRDPSIVSVLLLGGNSGGTYAAKNQAGALTNLPLEVHYNCLKAGSTAVRVVFTSDVNNADVQLEWTKKCAAQPAVAAATAAAVLPVAQPAQAQAQARAEAHARALARGQALGDDQDELEQALLALEDGDEVKSRREGKTAGSSEVRVRAGGAGNGAAGGGLAVMEEASAATPPNLMISLLGPMLALPVYEKAAVLPQWNRRDTRSTYTTSAANLTFSLTLTGDQFGPLAMGPPAVDVLHPGADSATAFFSGRGHRGGTVDAKGLKLLLVAKCNGGGVTSLRATLPFLNFRAVKLFWRIKCKGGPALGFSMTTEAGDAVVHDGTASDDWRDGSIAVDADEERTTFVVQHRGEPLTLGTPRVKAKFDFCNPTLSGYLATGGTVAPDASRAGRAPVLGSKGKGKGGFAVRKKDWLPGKGGGDAEALAERYGEYDPDAWTAQMQALDQVGYDGVRRRLALLDGARTGDRRVLGADAAPLRRLTVQYNCVLPGTVTITLTLPFSVYNTVVLTWTKACGSAKAREFFTVATTESLVVVNGAAQHGWDASDASVPLQTVSSHTDKSTFFLSMQRHASVQPFAGLADIDEDAWSVRGGGGDTAAVAADSAALVQKYGQPSVKTSNPDVCGAVVRGSVRRGGTLTAGKAQALEVKYHCLGRGDVVVEVTIPLELGLHSHVHYSWAKRCRRDVVHGLMVGSAPGLSDVVLDGVTSLRYERPTTLLAVTPLSQAVLPDVNKSVSFWFWVAADEAAVSLKAPVITSTPPICEPKVDGAMAAGVSLVPSGVIQDVAGSVRKSHRMDIQLNCYARGSALITVRIPSEDATFEDASFTFVKYHQAAGELTDVVGVLLLCGALLVGCLLAMWLRPAGQVAQRVLALGDFLGLGEGIKGHERDVNGGGGGGASGGHYGAPPIRATLVDTHTRAVARVVRSRSTEWSKYTSGI